MNGIIVECTTKDAVLLTDDGLFLKVRNRNYEIGQTITIQKSVRKSSKMIAGAASMAAALIISTIGGVAYYTPTEYVSLDVNPSIEYSVNRFGRILDVEAVNDDGEEILSELDLDHRSIEDALKQTIHQLITEGYLVEEDHNDVVITTSSKKMNQAEALAEELKEEVQVYLDKKEGITASVDAEAVGLNRVEEAKRLGVTPGKLNLVEKLQTTTNEAINKEKWLDMPVRDINQAIRENNELKRSQADQKPDDINQNDWDNLERQDNQQGNDWNQESGRTKSDDSLWETGRPKSDDSIWDTEKELPDGLKNGDKWNNQDDKNPIENLTGEAIEYDDEDSEDWKDEHNGNEDKKQNLKDRTDSDDESDEDSSDDDD